MFSKEKKIEVKAASENKISLFNIEIDFSGLAEVVALLFPSLRHERLVRYRTETIAKVSLETYRLANAENVQLNPIPAKMALPIVEKMSLEEEPDMFEKWSKLLLAAGVNPKPIHQQYADILFGLDSQGANFLKEIYSHQDNINIENIFDEYLDKSRFNRFFDNANMDYRNRVTIDEGPVFSFPLSFGQPSFDFPLIIYVTEKGSLKHFGFYFDGSASRNSVLLVFKDETVKLLLSLERMGLIKYQHIFHDQKKDEEGKAYFVSRCGVLLTQFGYSFIECLENPTK
jgi:hypothetical protein